MHPMLDWSGWQRGVDISFLTAVSKQHEATLEGFQALEQTLQYQWLNPYSFPHAIVLTAVQPNNSASMLRGRFDKAREAAGIAKNEFQLRDLRAKAGTDKAESSGDILQVRDHLGHTTVTITEAYIRDRKGKKVMPTK